jgi:predicted ABC-type ATPase
MSHGTGGSAVTRALAKTRKRRAPKPSRVRRPRVNTSTTVLLVEQVAQETTLSVTEIYQKIHTGEMRGMWVSKKRVVVHKEDLALWQAWKRGLMGEAEYKSRLQAPAKAGQA